MYLFSGEETCRNVMPACFVLSTKRTPFDCLPINHEDDRSDKKTEAVSGQIALKNRLEVGRSSLLIRAAPRFLF
jgi:hypothetical protein